MKPALTLLVLCLFLALGAVGLLVFTGNREAAAARQVTAASEPAAAPAAPIDPRVDEMAARMDAMARDVEALRAQVAAWQSGTAREPVAEAAPAKPLDEPAAAFDSEHRSAIFRIIEEDRQLQRQKQEEERRARDLEAALARAERTAKQFGLAADQQKALADVYILERQKMEEIRNLMRDQGGPGGDPEAMRTTFREIRDWRLTELTGRLGADLAEKINEADWQSFRGGFGAGGRRGNRAQNAQEGAPVPGDRPGGGF